MSLFVTIIGTFIGFLWGGVTSLILIFFLSILEISLSFDNAVVNAKVLQRMDPIWQKRFLFWGIIIAVFGVRFILPLFIVSIITHLGLFEVLNMAIENPSLYSTYLHKAHVPLSAFGGMFLFMVFLAFIFDSKRSIHWLGVLEKKMSQLGELKSIEIIMALLVLLGAQSLVPQEMSFHVLIPGIMAIVIYVCISTLTDFLEKREKLIKTGFLGFIYLEILDASFSFDSVLGAFAITKDIILIMIGLTIGAVFVRSITLFLVKKGTLKQYQYLEHGAHYAIGALAVLMLIGIVKEIPEIITGFIGVGFIMLSLFSSVLYNRNIRNIAKRRK